jgi:D-glycero-D-manno-heptose 1,7-bisphosphate phosphatase
VRTFSHGLGGDIFPVPIPTGTTAPPAAVLFDRDGTLVVDVPYNADPEQVRPVATARAALDLLRGAGIPVGVVTNQSGIARGLIPPAAALAVNARVNALLGPFAVWCMCPHGPDDGCACRKPRPGMVLEAAERLGVDPRDVAVVGDIGADLAAAEAAGARSVLVPTPVTRAEEVRAAPVVRPDLLAAVRYLLGRPGPAVGEPAPAGGGWSADPGRPDPATAGPAR